MFNDITDGEVDKLYECRRKFNAMKPVRDSIFENEEVRYDEEYIFTVISEKWGGWNDNKPIQINTRFRDNYTKRKDSAKAVKNNRVIILKKTDSILNKKK